MNLFAAAQTTKATLKTSVIARNARAQRRTPTAALKRKLLRQQSLPVVPELKTQKKKRRSSYYFLPQEKDENENEQGEIKRAHQGAKGD